MKKIYNSPAVEIEKFTISADVLTDLSDPTVIPGQGNGDDELDF